jgi:CheY-like chemotaxis protein
MSHEEKSVGRPSESGREARRPTVLVIDDSRYITLMVRKALESLKIEILSVSNGRQGETEVSRLGSNLDLILMDIAMPQQDGVTTLEHLRSNGFKVPVIMLTGNTEKQNLVKCARLGITDFLAKPFDVGFLRDKVAEVLGLSCPSKSQSKAGKSQRILVVDDQALTRLLIEDHLKQLGYEVFAVGSGSEALQELPLIRAGLVLINTAFEELTLPSKILEQRETDIGDNYGVIAFSSKEPDPDETCGEMDKVLPYPFSLVDLREAVVESLGLPESG